MVLALKGGAGRGVHAVGILDPMDGAARSRSCDRMDLVILVDVLMKTCHIPNVRGT